MIDDGQQILALNSFCFSFSLKFSFYIILQGAVNIYRLDDDTMHPIEYDFDPKSKFAEFDDDPEQREDLISQTFGNYVVTLGKRFLYLIDRTLTFIDFIIVQWEVLILENEPW